MDMPRKEGISMTWTSEIQYNQNDLECSGASTNTQRTIPYFNSKRTSSKIMVSSFQYLKKMDKFKDGDLKKNFWWSEVYCRILRFNFSDKCILFQRYCAVSYLLLMSTKQKECHRVSEGNVLRNKMQIYLQSHSDAIKNRFH